MLRLRKGCVDFLLLIHVSHVFNNIFFLVSLVTSALLPLPSIVLVFGGGGGVWRNNLVARGFGGRGGGCASVLSRRVRYKVAIFRTHSVRRRGCVLVDAWNVAPLSLSLLPELSRKNKGRWREGRSDGRTAVMLIETSPRGLANAQRDQVIKPSRRRTLSFHRVPPLALCSEYYSLLFISVFSFFSRRQFARMCVFLIYVV